ncbi:MAG TPA: AI-2E family transporter, partial [Acidimicrobiia bacterium]
MTETKPRPTPEGRRAAGRWEKSPPWLPHAAVIVVAVIAGAIAAGWVLYELRTLVYMLFLALFISVALEPAVQRLEGWGWRRRRATMLVFAVALVLVVG